MKDYSPFCLRILFLRRCLAAYLSLTLLCLGAGIGRADDKKPFFNTPPKHEERLACAPVPKSDNPVVQRLLEQVMGKPAVKGPDNAAQPAAAEQPSYKDFSLAAKPGQNSFSLARQAGNNQIPNYNYLPQKPLVGLTDISILVETPIPKARSTEPLVKIYQTLPWDMMPNALGKGAKDDQATEKKSPWWKWPAIIVGAAVVGVGAYELFFKKKTNPVIDNKPVPVTLNFDVYKYPTGFVTTITKQAMSNSSVSIGIGDTGVNDVDSSYFFLYDGNNHTANGTTGTISFTTPNTTTPNTTKTYNVVLMPKLVDLNGYSPGVSYSWMTGQGIIKSTRNIIVYRQDRDNQDGPEGSWTSVWSQLRAPLSFSWLKLGSITEKPKPNDSIGTFSYGYAICIDPATGNRVDGLHGGDYIIVDAERNNTESSRKAVGLEEAFENICLVQNIGGKPSLMTIQFQGVLNDTGRALLAYVFLKDGTGGVQFNPSSSQSLGYLAASIASSAEATKLRQMEGMALPINGRRANLNDIITAMPMLVPLSLQGRAGKFAFGGDLASRSLYTSFGNGNAGVTTRLVNAGGLADWIVDTEGVVNYKGVSGAFGMTQGAGNSIYKATVAKDLMKDLALGISSLYQNGANSVQVHVAAFRNNENSHVLGFSVASTTGNGMHSQRYAAALNLGAVVVDGTYQKFSQHDFSLALNLSAKLGRAVILGSYSHEQLRQISQDFGRLAVMLPLGPGFVDASLFKMSGQKPGLSAKYTVQIVF
jgi:hypothetical protein